MTVWVVAVAVMPVVATVVLVVVMLRGIVVAVAT